ncbi:MAG: DUF192 domain-containing protein [Granulosicoccus sp.]|nr:DUF192 domain-containing protein [Granulosicoccus sp.]
MKSKLFSCVDSKFRLQSIGSRRQAIAMNALARILCTGIALGLSFSAPLAAERAQAELPVIELRINDVMLQTEVAATAQQRYMGLSYREQLGRNEGMLFVFDTEQSVIFTMRNTLIPLSIAFLSKDLVINEIHQMNVGPGQRFPSKQKAQFALEVNQGWFTENKIKRGDRIELQSALPMQ